jgi:hypothetical protein
MERQHWIVLFFFVATLGLLYWAFDWTGVSSLPGHLKEKSNAAAVAPKPEPEVVMGCEELLKQGVVTLEMQEVNFDSTRVALNFTPKNGKKVTARVESGWKITPVNHDPRHSWVTLENTQEPLHPQATKSMQVLAARWAPLDENIELPQIESSGESMFSSEMVTGNFKLEPLGADKPLKRLLDQMNETKPLPEWEVLQMAVWIFTMDVDLETIRKTTFTRPRGGAVVMVGSTYRLFASMTQVEEVLELVKASGVDAQATRISRDMEGMLSKATEDFHSGRNAIQALETIGMFAHRENVRALLLQVANSRTSDEDKDLRGLAYKALSRVIIRGKGAHQALDNELLAILTHLSSVEQEEKNKRIINTGLMESRRAIEGLFKEAAKRGDAAAIDVWVANGVNVNIEDGEAFALAAQGNHTDAVKMLIKNGGNPGLRGGADALLRSAEKSNVELMKLLLEKGADRYAKGDIGGRALWWSARNGNASMIQLLLDKGVSVNSGLDVEQSSPLMQAIQNDHEDCVKLLVDKGADVNASNLFGKSVLKLATEKDNSSVIKLLKKAGAKE